MIRSRYLASPRRIRPVAHGQSTKSGVVVLGCYANRALLSTAAISCIPAFMIFSSLRAESGVCATLMPMLGCGRTELIDLGGKRMVATPGVKILYGDVIRLGA